MVWNVVLTVSHKYCKQTHSITLSDLTMSFVQPFSIEVFAVCQALSSYRDIGMLPKKSWEDIQKILNKQNYKLSQLVLSAKNKK